MKELDGWRDVPEGAILHPYPSPVTSLILLRMAQSSASQTHQTTSKKNVGKSGVTPFEKTR